MTIDRLAEAERAVERPPRSVSLAWLGEATTWFALAVAGMLVVFAGLAVDAYRHNHSASEELLLSLGNPGHLLAAIGLAITSVAVLAGLSVSALKGAERELHRERRKLYGRPALDDARLGDAGDDGEPAGRVRVPQQRPLPEAAGRVGVVERPERRDAVTRL